jgi:hypothetical protein
MSFTSCPTSSAGSVAFPTERQTKLGRIDLNEESAASVDAERGDAAC